MSTYSTTHVDPQKTEMSLSEIYDIIFSLLRSALWGEEKFPFLYPASVDWISVHKELQIQTIQILPVDLLIKTDKMRSSLYLQNTAKSIRFWHVLMQEQQNLYQLFKKSNIPFAILKGAGADYYYPQPAYRCMGDIDFIVHPSDFDRAMQIMSEHGYTVLDLDDYRHKEYKKNGVLFEMHRFFSILNDDTAANWLDGKIFDALNHLQEQSIDGFSFPMLPTLENGLVLLCHINQHLESGLGLRQIIDWMLFVSKEVDDTYWYSTFSSAAEQIGLKTLAITVTRMCQIYLGLTEEITWCQNADFALCNNLLEYIIDQGNFGRKRGKESNTAINTMSFRSTRALFEMLQRRGLNNWKACKKYSFLKPFAWIYQTFRYLHLGLKRQHPFRQLKEEHLQSQARNKLFEQLRVTRRANGISTPDGIRFQ